jgi:hypothetical protein
MRITAYSQIDGVKKILNNKTKKEKLAMVNSKLTNIVESLKGIQFPATKDKLIEYAQAHGAGTDVIATLRRLPDGQEFKGSFSLAEALAQTAPEAPAQPAPRAAGGSWMQYLYTGEAGSRTYFVYTPVNYQGSAVPLFVMLHGCGEDAETFATVTHMNQLADQKQFIVVYPQQGSAGNQEQCWDWFDSSQQSRGSGEPAILAGITQEVQRNTTQFRPWAFMLV